MSQDVAKKIEELNRKREELEECNRNIERIRAELERAKIRQARQRQLAAVAKAPHNNIGLPRNVIGHIFTIYNRETSMGLRTLFKVCKGWKEIIEDRNNDESRKLWASVKINIPPEASRIDSCTKYCEKAVEMSREELLDISLDYTKASLPWERILYEHVLESLSKLCDDSEYREKLYDWLPKRVRRDTDQFKPHYSTHFFKPLAALTGEKGSWMNRWRSFELEGQQTSLSLFQMHDIMRYLKYDATNLESITITNTGRYVTVWGRGDWFHQLPNLKRLSLNYVHVSAATIAMDPLKVETLDLPWFSDFKDLAVILNCTNLKTLNFSIKHGLNAEADDAVDLTIEHTFPHLQRLQVGGNVPELFWRAVRFPVLGELIFGDRHGSTPFIANQNISLPKVEKVTFYGPLAKEPITVKQVLGALVRSCPNLVTLRVLDKYEKETVEVLQELRSEGIASDSLKKLELQTRRNSDEADPGQLFDYYKRAYDLANALRRRQDPPPTDPPTSSTIPPSSSSIISVSSQSQLSTSSLSSVLSTSTASASNTTTPPTSTLASITSDVSSTLSTQILTTDSTGNQVTTTVVIVPTATATNAPANKTNTGAIVGGVVGGVALLALILVGIWLIRRKMKHDEFEANIFDPDRNVQRPHSSDAGPKFDLGGGAAAGVAGAGTAVAAHDAASNVTPYPHSSSGGGGPASTYYGSSVGGQPEMQHAPSTGYYPDYNQYGQNNVVSFPQQPHYQQPSIGVGEHFPNPYAPGFQAAGYPAAAGAGMGLAAGGAGLMRGPTTASTATNTTTSNYHPTTMTSPIYSSPSEGRGSPSGSPPPSMAALAPGAAPLSARAAKEREAFSRSRPNFTVTNASDNHPPVGMPNEAAYGGVAPMGGGARDPSPVPSRTSNHSTQPMSPVVVHQDGGRVPDNDDDDDRGAEIPPTYDSIPQDRR
ncbi:hypothetical protein CPB86DRAFT_825282 [Serendipita vermifera]|nr:hypothetical protein CPB86DRAFT_825282 [Serendipita vermifera]